MANVILSVELIVDIPNAKVSATVQKISDSMGQDRTEDFRKFCGEKSLPLSSQGDIEQAVVEFAKARQTSLP